MKRTCKKCGVEDNNMAKVKVKCDECDKPLERKKHISKRNKHNFCDRNCRSKWVRKNAIGKNSTRWNGGSVIVTCNYCGEGIERAKNEARRSKNNFCNHKCYGSWLKENKAGDMHPCFTSIKISCDYCGEKITRCESLMERNKNNFCSKVCMGKWNSKNRIGLNHPGFVFKIKVLCDYCGEEIEKTETQVSASKKHFCNEKCMGKWGKQRIIKAPCDYCGKEVIRQASHIKKYTFCSKKTGTNCEGKWRSENLIGHKSANWQGGPISIKCAQCGKLVDVTRSRVKDGKDNFCNRKCMIKCANELGDSFIKTLLSKYSYIKKNNITPEMIVIKRELIMHQRTIKELYNVINRKRDQRTERTVSTS